MDKNKVFLCVRKIPSFKGYLATSNGDIYSLKTNKILKKNRCGTYFQLKLYNGCKAKTVKVHKLIAMAFYGEKPGQIVRHIDGNPRNNNATNLKYGNLKENAHDRYNHGTMFKHSVSESLIVSIRNDFHKNKKRGIYKKLSIKYNKSEDFIRRIISGRTWKKNKSLCHEKKQLSKEDAIYILSNYKKTSSNKSNVNELAKKFNVHKCTILNVVNKKTFKNIGDNFA